VTRAPGLLFPTGTLIAQGQPPFGGSVDSSSFNESSLSAVPLHYWRGARRYTNADSWYAKKEGKRPSAWTPAIGQAEIERIEKALQMSGGIQAVNLRDQVNVERDKIQLVEKLLEGRDIPVAPIERIYPP